MFLDLTPLARSAKIQCLVQDVPSGAGYNFLVSVVQRTLRYYEVIVVVVQTPSPTQLGLLMVW